MPTALPALPVARFSLLRRAPARTALTSNKGFEDWGEVLGDDVMAAALIDRLLHHCHIVSIRGNSYRMRHHTDLFPVLTPTLEGEEAQPRRRKSRREAPTP